MLTSNYGAQYGRNGSGTVEIETKSGTKSFHGDVYEFVRNDAFNARNYFAPSVPPYKKNDFGYTIGGPVSIPDVYNENKQKTFFFFSEEWRREYPTTFNVPVPSCAERGLTGAAGGRCTGRRRAFGDFSEPCNLPPPTGRSIAPSFRTDLRREPASRAILCRLIRTRCRFWRCFLTQLHARRSALSWAFNNRRQRRPNGGKNCLRSIRTLRLSSQPRYGISTIHGIQCLRFLCGPTAAVIRPFRCLRATFDQPRGASDSHCHADFAERIRCQLFHQPHHFQNRGMAATRWIQHRPVSKWLRRREIAWVQLTGGNAFGGTCPRRGLCSEWTGELESEL